MSKRDLARLEGEIFGLKVLLLQCLGTLASAVDDPKVWLGAIETNARSGIASATNSDVDPRDLQHFREVAAGLVIQALQAALASLEPASSRRTVQ